MSTSETFSDITPKRRVIANQAAELITLKQKLSRFEGIGKKFEHHKDLLDQSLKAKHALQEIFFNTSVQKREMESENTQLKDIISSKDHILKEWKQDCQLQNDSIQSLHSLELSSITKKCNKITLQKECFIDALKAKHRYKSDLSNIKYETLNTKYKLIAAENKQLIKELKLFKAQFQSQIELMETERHINEQYKPILVSLLEQYTQSKQGYCTQLKSKHKTLQELHAQNQSMRQMYNSLESVVSEQDNKCIELTNKNNKLNAIISQNEKNVTKMQKHFQNDISDKARTIAKLENKIEQIMNNSTDTANANDRLKEKNELIQTQCNALKSEKGLLKNEIKNVKNSVKNKNEYIETLKEQIEDNNGAIQKLNRENTNVKTETENRYSELKDRLTENDSNFKKLSAKYKTLQLKAQRLANKLKQIYSDKKALKREHISVKQELNRLKDANVRMDKENDTQNDALQKSIEKYKEKIGKYKKKMSELETNCNESVAELDKECNRYKQQIQLLKTENEQQKFLIEHLEIDSNEHMRIDKKRTQIRKQNRNIYTAIEKENVLAQTECSDILTEIAEESPNTSVSGSKRRRSVDIEEDHNGSDNSEYEPPKKRVRGDKNKNREVRDATPFKASKSMFKGRKPRNKTKKNINLPKPKLV